MTAQIDEDSARLAELGYKQELHRSWSGFSNFAISFSIISILAGCFTTFFQAWNNGGPVAISWGWPLISLFILIIGFCMSELVSAYPTSGGIYWWASKLGGVKAGYYTGWLNLVGLVIISALNIFSSHLLAIINNISVWWHVAGATAVVLILIFVPDHHQSISYVFTERVNNTGGLFGGETNGAGFWFYVMPLGFLLTQYTITGYDASAHLSEETHQAADSAAKGIWQSIFYSAIGGWLLLLAFVFAVQDGDGVSAGGGGVAVVFDQALGSKWGGLVLLIAASGQLYCSTACLTSTTRMLFAFSRDG